jgi:hypothetical protein
MDQNGNGIAVWHQWDGAMYNIWVNRYISGTGWSGVQLIETDNTGYARYPQIAMDQNGNGIAVWCQSDGTRHNIWANRYISGTGWQGAELIEQNPGDAWAPQIAMDQNGNGIAVWCEYDGTRYNIWANRYISGTGWSGAQLIETDNTEDAGVPQIAMDQNGNGIAVWCQDDGTRYNIWANRYE